MPSPRATFYLNLMKDPNPNVRQKAAQAIGKIGDKSCRECEKEHSTCRSQHLAFRFRDLYLVRQPHVNQDLPKFLRHLVHLLGLNLQRNVKMDV